MIGRIRAIFEDLKRLRKLPAVSVDVMLGETEMNDPFYGELVRKFLVDVHRRHRRFPLVRAMVHGAALCVLPDSVDDYFRMIEAAGRRNVKKCRRLGYVFKRISYNDYLRDISEIRRSAPTRQGALPSEFLAEELKPCTDPPTLTDVHDYAYFGVLLDGTLVAFAGCLVAGELFSVEQVYGHADHLSDGVVPLLMVDMAGYAKEHYPRVRYYMYGTYFGAGQTMRRFKRKFGLNPHRVQWLADRDVS